MNSIINNTINKQRFCSGSFTDNSIYTTTLIVIFILGYIIMGLLNKKQSNNTLSTKHVYTPSKEEANFFFDDEQSE